MTPNCASVSVSIVIEWENAGRIGDERARQMLRALHEQVNQADPEQITITELIFVFAKDTDISPIDFAIAEACDGREWGACIRREPAPVSSYYELKNYGAGLASGDIIIFLDSDVIPQAGWLDRIVAPFHDPDTMIVSGATWTGYTGLYSSAMALGWIFPVRPESETIAPTSGFHANNVAFRSELRPAMSFPTTDQYRGQGVSVIDQLRVEGLTILLHQGAQVTHPPPHGLKGFTTRALWSGYDLSVRKRADGQGGYWQGVADVTHTGAMALYRVGTQFRRVKLRISGALGAAMIVGTYHGLRLVGFVAGFVAPKLLHKLLTRIAP